MVVKVELKDDELALIKQATSQDNAAVAVTKAAREFLRINQLKQLKSATAEVDYNVDREGLESLEMGELPGKTA
jgi:hypothetical protein